MKDRQVQIEKRKFQLRARAKLILDSTEKFKLQNSLDKFGNLAGSTHKKALASIDVSPIKDNTFITAMKTKDELSQTPLGRRSIRSVRQSASQQFLHTRDA